MRTSKGLNPKIYLPIALILAAGNIALLVIYAIPALQNNPPTPTSGVTSTSQPPLSTPIPSQSPTVNTSKNSPSPRPITPSDELRQQGCFVFAMSDGLYSHLFAYHPQFFPLTRLTNGSWDDISPSISPDGDWLAYASRQNGYWDIYRLQFSTGKTFRLTDSPEYEGSPSWSSDSQWLAIERLIGRTMQIFLIPVGDPKAAPVQLTNDTDASYSPAWSPKGREVAFVSTKASKENIWIARLDRIDDRFVNLTRDLPGSHRQPRWLNDGNQLAWNNETEQGSQILVWNANKPDDLPRLAGRGEFPSWNANGSSLAGILKLPNQNGLSIFNASSAAQTLPLTLLPGQISGLAWVSGAPVDWLLKTSFPEEARVSKAPLWKPKTSASTAPPAGRNALVALADVTVPYPYLQDSIDDAFTALREATGRITGWDFLANLENAYTPLTISAPPGMSDNWLYTGRAIAINAQPMPAGWMVIAREEIEGKTFWRVFLRARFQDGSQGLPLTTPVWNLDARNSGSPIAYEQGGEIGQVPEGYWVDFTDLASRFGWQRLPALVNWRTFYPAIQFNILIQADGLTWKAAMNQLYPPEAIATPTQVLTHSITPSPTRTPWYYQYLTPSITPSITLTPTRRPTLTPLATQKAP